MKAAKLFLTFVLFAAVVIVGCSKDETPTNPGGGGSTAYYGSFANGSENGSMAVTFASAPSKVGAVAPSSSAVIITLTGTLKIQGGATISLAGTYNTETDSFKISGGGYTFQGTYANGVITGSYSGPNGPGDFALTATTSGSVKIFCGNYTETTPTAGQHHGKLNIVVDGASITVLVRPDDGGGAVFKGTLDGSAVTVFFSGTAGPVLAQGTLESSTHMTGHYNDGETQGDWSADLCQ